MVISRLVGVNDSSSEDFVFLSLSRKPMLSAKEVFAEVKRYGLNVTYQAVHKKLKELCQKNILLFKEQKYSINRDWLFNAKAFLENIDLELIKSKEKVKKTEAVCMSFDSYADFASHMLREFAKERELEPNGVCVTCQKHFYWIFSISKTDYEILKMLGGGRKSYIVCEARSLVDKLLAPIYSKFGWKVITGLKHTENYDWVVYNNWIHQIFFSEGQKKFIETVCKKVKNLEKFTSDFQKKYFENKGKIKVIIFKDKELAQQLKASALKHFKEKER